ncbi:MAG TPA: CHASE3 domain-containing protein [Burkholderiaceae bacterium]|nr:CHASE3 domain-containing protein [Burkholderiaceae bacterium]
MRWLSIPQMAVSLPLAILAVIALVGINETGYWQSIRAAEEIEQAQRTRGVLHKLLQQMLDAETGQRGFLLTGDPRYLEPYSAATADINQSLDSLHKMYAEQPRELLVFAQLASHAARKLAEMDVSVRLRKQGNEEAWKFVLTTDVGKEHMDAIREQSSALIATSTSRMERAQIQIGQSLHLARIGVAVVALVGLLAFYMYLRQTIALKQVDQRQQEALENERDRLGRLVKERTASLTELATHLQQVREDERGHLARELHDELGSLLTAAKLDVARLKSKLAGDAPEMALRLQHLTETLNSGIALKRRIIEDLRPSSLSNLGLVASLEILAREFAERSGLSVTTDVETVELDAATQLTVYRLVQESLTNVGKYARARQVTISLQDFEHHVSVEVQDDGAGFDVATIRPTAHGLAGMRHRVEAAGGRLSIASAENAGTRVSAVLPKGT